jgi:glutathione synthase/RimK-type ligase-like ATP-grasp enzyme
MSRPTKVLLLTAKDPSALQSAWPLDQHLRERGCEVDLRHWRDKSLDIDSLSNYDRITFLWCLDYHMRSNRFYQFLNGKVLPAQRRSKVRTMNAARMIIWNVDKATYLEELQQAGFPIIETEFFSGGVPSFDTGSQLRDWILHLAKAHRGQPIVLKPSISASAKSTHLLDPSNVSDADMEYFEDLIENGLGSALLIQALEPSISEGEYSVIFLAGRYSHTVLKTPQQGEFKCQSEFGGTVQKVPEDEVPRIAKSIAENVIEYITEKFSSVAYARIDGIMRSSDEFLIMEVELIEPELWVDEYADPVCREAFYQLFVEV